MRQLGRVAVVAAVVGASLLPALRAGAAPAHHGFGKPRIWIAHWHYSCGGTHVSYTDGVLLTWGSLGGTFKWWADSTGNGQLPGSYGDGMPRSGPNYNLVLLNGSNPNSIAYEGEYKGLTISHKGGTIGYADCWDASYTSTTYRFRHWKCNHNNPLWPPAKYDPWPATKGGQYIGGCVPLWGKKHHHGKQLA